METQNMADTTRKSSWTEHEAGNQEKWKDLVDSGRCRNVWKQICPQCGKEFYTMNRFRKYCHLSDCRDQAKQERNEKKEARALFGAYLLRLLRFFCFQADRCQILQQRLQTKGVSKKEVNSDAVFDICIARPVISQYMWLHFDAIYVSVCGSESEPFSS